MGPTAVGKTKLSLLLAQEFNAEIFSSDSRQVFEEMNIGTAKPNPAELHQVKHHFISTRSIKQDYSAGKYEEEIVLALDQYFDSKEVAILSGGTGLYIDAVLVGLDSFPEIPNDVEEKVNQLEKVKGLDYLTQELQKLDPEYFEKVDIQNSRRISRALKVIYGSGKKYSSFLNQDKQTRRFETINLLLERDRPELYQRINQRVDEMMKNGQLEEAKSLFKNKDLRSLQTVGYKEIFDFLEGNCDIEFCIEEIKKNTRRYAKRQITWFKKYNAKTFHPSQEKEIVAFINEQLSL